MTWCQCRMVATSTPPPPATALPGWSAQSGVGLCGAGTFSPTCGGTILYAGAPGTGRNGVPTSTWAEASVDDEYAQENLERFFLDLGINAVDILILSPVHDARDAYDAARRGDHATAVLYVSFTVCDVVKQCQSILAPAKALRRAARSTRTMESGGLNLYRAGRDGNRHPQHVGHLPRAAAQAGTPTEPPVLETTPTPVEPAATPTPVETASPTPLPMV